ncbi:MAG TPA: glycosyltransferase [Candidatus Andersenbacteria bacterium]|nr:glycosyltransferase [Candidatus Andersenbacteria bacterium]
MKQSLSVWMPNYNHAKYVGRAIDAIASQSRLPDEFVIIDDASTDNSKEVLQQYAAKYPWIRIEYSTKNEGVLAIMQKAATACTSDYLFLTAADDFILQGFFETAMHAMEKYPDAGILFGQMKAQNEEGMDLYIGKASEYKDSQYISPEEYLNYMKHEAPNHSLSAGTIYKTVALGEMGGFQMDLGPWTDTFSIQAIALRYGAYYMAQPVSVWVIHAHSISQGVRRSPFFMFGIIRNAIKTMKSPGFHQYFPDSYIASWAFKYRITILLQYVAGLFSVSSLPTNPRWQQWHQKFLRVIS